MASINDDSQDFDFVTSLRKSEQQGLLGVMADMTRQAFDQMPESLLNEINIVINVMIHNPQSTEREVAIGMFACAYMQIAGRRRFLGSSEESSKP